MLARNTSRVFILVAFLVAVSGITLAQQDNWLVGGPGNWSNSGRWSAGLPGSNSDVLIANAVGDSVFLDVSATINSLTLGQDNYGMQGSFLSAAGPPQTLTVTGTTMLGLSGIANFNSGTLNTSSLVNHGQLQISGSSILNVTGTFTNGLSGGFFVGGVANVGGLTNNNFGIVWVEQGGTLNLTNQLGGVTDVPYDTFYRLDGSFNDVMGGGSGFAHLTSVEGGLYLYNGQTISVTPNGGVLSVNITDPNFSPLSRTITSTVALRNGC